MMGSVTQSGLIHPVHVRLLQWVPKRGILSWRSTGHLLSWETHFVHAEQTLCGLGLCATSPPKSHGTVSNSLQLFPTFHLCILTFFVIENTLLSTLHASHKKIPSLMGGLCTSWQTAAKTGPMVKSPSLHTVVTPTSLLGEDVSSSYKRWAAGPVPVTLPARQSSSRWGQ